MKLAATPGIQRVPSPKLELFIVRNFLNPTLCGELTRRIDDQKRPSEITDDIGVAAFRTSETCDLDWHDPVVGAVDAQIADLLGLPLNVSEPLQGQRYAAGQEFKPHTDTFEPGGAAFYEHCADTGQRTWTVMIYLNEPSMSAKTEVASNGHMPESST